MFAPRNATWFCWEVQNQIISFMGSQTQKKIVSVVAENKYFLILTDESADMSQIDQLNLFVRFVKGNFFHEEFFSFVPVFSAAGEILASTVLT